MNNTRQSTSNGFAQGLIMDYHESGTPNTALTNALNATFVTYNGNEAILQNDLGNGRVESAYLPEGFIPLGTTSFGGIIYIVSYNPIDDVCQVGSFPSPERNFTEGEPFSGSFSFSKDKLDYNKTKNFQLVIPLLTEDSEEITLSTGDKFALSLDNIPDYYGFIQDLLKNSEHSSNDPCIKLVLGIRRDGQLRELTEINTFDEIIDNNIYTYMTFNNSEGKTLSDTIESYRGLIESPYNIINCNISGTLCLIIKIVTLDTFNEFHKIKFIELSDEQSIL